jgi:hypothetical protein
MGLPVPRPEPLLGPVERAQVMVDDRAGSATGHEEMSGAERIGYVDHLDGRQSAAAESLSAEPE